MIGLQEPEPISIERFEDYIGRVLPRRLPSSIYYTYIAKSPGCDLYKIGHSRNPIRRGERLQSRGYGGFVFTMEYFLKGDIEHDLLFALYLSGAKQPSKRARDESFFLTRTDVEYIVSRCNFHHISDYYKV